MRKLVALPEDTELEAYEEVRGLGGGRDPNPSLEGIRCIFSSLEVVLSFLNLQCVDVPLKQCIICAEGLFLVPLLSHRLSLSPQ